MTKGTRYFLAGSAAVIVAGLCTGLIAYYSGGFQSVSASTGPTELAYVPADAMVVAYADVRSIMDSELRQQFRQAVPDASEREEFQQKTGIDIERDIDYVVAAMTAIDPGRHSALVVARGRFDIVRLEGLAREHGGTVEEYREKRLITSPESHGGDQVSIAFLEPGLVAVGSASAVRHAIDAQMSAQSITGNEEMMELVKEIETANNVQNNAWAVGRFDLIANQANLPDEIANKIPPVNWFAAAGHINGGVSGMVRAEARDDQSATQLRDVVRGLLALAQLQAQSDPRVASIAQSLQVSGEGKTVALSFSIPAEFLRLVAPKVEAQ